MAKYIFLCLIRTLSEKRAIITAISTSKQLNLSAAQIASFTRASSYVGVPFYSAGRFIEAPLLMISKK